MKIQEAIEKAMKVGWDDGNFAMTKDETTTYFVKVGNWYYNQDFLLDPEFWKCLGKAMGWEEDYYHLDYRLHDDKILDEFIAHRPEWNYRQHRLIDHLAEGGTINSYFETL
ncbi:MAG: hypothetical protein WC803_12840 [Sphingomonas sp.]|jgi:hypothetical protein